MNVLELLFDRKNGIDELNVDCRLLIDNETAGQLAIPHFICDVQVADEDANSSDQTVTKRKTPEADQQTFHGTEALSSATLNVETSEGQLILSAPWMGRVRIGTQGSLPSAETVANILRIRLNHMAACLHDLHTCSLSAQNASSLLNVAFRVCGFALVLFDASSNLIGYELGDTLETEAFRKTVERGYAMSVPEEHQRKYRDHAAQHAEGFETIFIEVERNTVLWVQPLQTCHGQTYFLHVMLGRASMRGLRAFIEEVSNELRAFLERREEDPNYGTHGDFLVELAIGTLDERQARIRASFLGWHVRDKFRIARIESFGMYQPASKLKEIAHELTHMIDDFHAVALDHSILCLLDNVNKPVVNCMPPTALTLLKHEHMILMISDSLAELSAVKGVHHALQLAFDVVRRNNIKSEIPIITYDELRYPLLVDALTSAAKIHDVTPCALAQVQAWDSEHGDVRTQS